MLLSWPSVCGPFCQEQQLPSRLSLAIILLFPLMAMASQPSSNSTPNKETKPNAGLFFQWLNFRNASSYSPIAPASPESLLQLNSSAQMDTDGLGLTTGQAEQVQRLASRKMRKHRHRVDANTPFTRRAICPFHFVLNHRPNRVPSTLVEVKCLSPSPSQFLLGRALPLVECEPMRWTLRVLECQNGEASQCQQREERITMACVPVLQANRDKGEEVEELEEGEKEQRSSPVVVAVVPAEPEDDEEAFVPT